MTMHCAGRLGVLNWLYEQRHVIAFELGLIEEKPIAECGSAYLQDRLVIVQQDDSQASPSPVFSAKEINLFCDVEKIILRRDFSSIEPQCPTVVLFYSTPSRSGVFHPPLA
jgi:hypothetical protein